MILTEQNFYFESNPLTFCMNATLLIPIKLSNFKCYDKASVNASSVSSNEKAIKVRSSSHALSVSLLETKASHSPWSLDRSRSILKLKTKYYIFFMYFTDWH
ncbi:hypothetical protein FF021_18330 [Leptospira noguchii]|nr:hypothetical protein FF021_18330 [Leptospira noguchii]